MLLSEAKSILSHSNSIAFRLPNGELVPSHFHVTEIGLIDKHFIDCGGTVRKEQKVNFQLWNADDYNHRLHPEKLVSIIELSERVLGIPDLEIEVEYQGETIGKYGCLARGICGIPEEKPRVRLSQLQASGCAPGSGCC